jgi:hypothetical protein
MQLNGRASAAGMIFARVVFLAEANHSARAPMGKPYARAAVIRAYAVRPPTNIRSFRKLFAVYENCGACLVRRRQRIEEIAAVKRRYG